MSTAERRRAAPGWAAVVLVASAMGLLGWMHHASKPVDAAGARSVPEDARSTATQSDPAAPDAGETHATSAAVPGAPLPCLSYAPFRRQGHTPFDARIVVTPAQIEEDLRILAGHGRGTDTSHDRHATPRSTLPPLTRCVRTYGLDHGIDAVPGIAQRLGMRVVLGAWIGRDAAANRLEIDLAIELAHAHRDTVSMIVVGNEVLLRRELEAPALAALLADARRRSPVPVAYADVWEFWLRHAAVLREHVDVVAVHVLPYWEDEPVAIDAAVAHVRATLALVREAFVGHRVWLAETGWPAAGRQRGHAVPGAAEQARFVRGMLATLPPDERASGGMNFIEAFDQPWKRALEGTVGGHWGLVDASASVRAGPWGDGVSHTSAWRSVAAWGAVTGAALALVGMRRVRGRRAQPGFEGATPVDAVTVVVVGTAVGAGLGAAAAWQWRLTSDGAFDAAGWTMGLATIIVGAGAAGVAMWRLARMMAGMHPIGAVGAGAGAHVVDAGAASSRERLASRLHVAWLAWTAVLALQLVFDARYRDVAWPMLAATTVVVLAWQLAGGRPRRNAQDERALGVWLALAAPLIVWNEGIENTQAWSAVFACGGAAVSALLPRVHERRTCEGAPPGGGAAARSHASSATTAAGADKPAP